MTCRHFFPITFVILKMIISFICSKKVQKKLSALLIFSCLFVEIKLVGFLRISSIFGIPHDYDVKIYQEEQEVQAG